MWKRMRALYDPDEILSSFKTRLAQYPAGLAKAVIGHHQAALGDVEDLKRAYEVKPEDFEERFRRAIALG
jgi:hypothetical protein